MTSEHSVISNKNELGSVIDIQGLLRDRSWLLPSNRKLRHLQGLSLRNLTLSRPATRPRGKTIDDESLPHAFKSPAKLLAQRESRKLEHSKSSSDLKLPHLQDDKGKGEAAIIGENGYEERKPLSGLMRRRSTLTWANAAPGTRQAKLEDAIASKTADTFFSLHCLGFEEPIYISEVVEKAMNPSFRFFDLKIYGPSVTRRDELTIKFWAKSQKMEEYILLIELQIHLGSLQYVGKALENFRHPLPPNCVLFHLSDGIYTSFTDLPLDEPIPSIPHLSKPNQVIQPTSSFDALMQLSNLDDCIQDALATREKLSTQINNLLAQNRRSLNTLTSVSQDQESLASTERAITSTRKSLDAAKSRRYTLQTSLATRLKLIEAGKTSQAIAEEEQLLSSDRTLLNLRTRNEATSTAINAQISRIAQDLSSIYAIEQPVPHKPLSFAINSLPLPSNANSSSSSSASPVAEANTAAALGMVARLVYLLSHYLSVHLPYPIDPNESTSFISDPVSLNLPKNVHDSSNNNVAGRRFPLFQRGSVQYRFEYGVYLLNCDIETVMWRRGLRMVDIRCTLGNLKYLMAVLGSGGGGSSVSGVGKTGAGVARRVVGGNDGGADGTNDEQAENEEPPPPPAPPNGDDGNEEYHGPEEEVGSTLVTTTPPPPPPPSSDADNTQHHHHAPTTADNSNGKGKGKSKLISNSNFNGNGNGLLKVKKRDSSLWGGASE